MNSIPRQRDVYDVDALRRTTYFVPLDVETLPRYTAAADLYARFAAEQVADTRTEVRQMLNDPAEIAAVVDGTTVDVTL